MAFLHNTLTPHLATVIASAGEAVARLISFRSRSAQTRFRLPPPLPLVINRAGCDPGQGYFSFAEQ